MKIKKILPILALTTILALPAMVSAADPAPPATLEGLIDAIKTPIWVIFGLIALICFVYAGIIFLTAGGAPDKIERARSAVMYGVVGVAVGVIAYGIVAIVSGILGA